MLTARLFLTSTILLASSATFAATEYNFLQEKAWTAGALTFGGGAGDLLVSAENDPGIVPSYIRSNTSYGLMVCSVAGGTPGNNWFCGGDWENPEDEHYVDSIGPREAVVFNFQQAVTLSSAGFTAGSYGYGGFDLWVDGVLALTGEGFGTSVAFTGISGSEFTFRSGGDAQDYFKMSSLTVAEIPIPAAAWLFGSGLIGLATIARKRKLAS